MKIKIYGLFTLLFVNLFAVAASAAQPFDASPYKMQGNYVLHQTALGEIEKGRGEYTIKLIGEQPAGANFNKKLFLEVTPPKGRGDTTLIPLQDDINGFEPRIELKNFRNHEKNDIFLVVNGADRTFKNKFYILELGDYENRFIYDSLAVSMPIVKGNFRAGYKLRVLVLDTEKESFIDLAPRKAHYNQRGIYNEKNGALRREVTAWGGQFVELEPVDIDGDQIYELRGLMVMYGTGPTDPLVQVQSVLKYTGGGWYVVRSNTAPLAGLDFVRPAQKTAQPVKKTKPGRIVKIRRATPTVRRPVTAGSSAGTIETAPAAAPLPTPQ